MEKWSRLVALVIVLGGALLIGVATVADWIGLLGSPGIALKQALLGVGGGVTMLIGLGMIVRGMPEKAHRLLGSHARHITIGALAVILACGFIVGAVGLVRIHGLRTTDDALPLLKELITRDYPQMREGQLDDWDNVRLLRSWVYEYADWGSGCAKLNAEQYVKFFHADVATIFSMFLKDEGAVDCCGTAWALMRLYQAYGYEAYRLAVDIPGVMSHAMTLVRINHGGRDILTVHDATFDIGYVDPDGEPYDYFELLRVARSGRHELVETEQGVGRPGDYLFCTDEAFAEQQYWSVPGDAPVPALSQGRMKVEFGLTIDNWWDFYGAAIADSFAQAGYPPHLCYMFLNLLYIKQGYEDAPELMERATSILDQSPP